MAEIVFDQVHKTYPDGFAAVTDLSLTLDDGQFLVLVGPSGCGKSTALRMVAGLEDITDGEVRIGGRVVNGLAPRERDVAMVFQSYALYPHLTVRDNIGFGLRVRGMSAAERQREIARAAEMLELTPYLDRKPAHLSGGQRQRVAMGRAIVRRPAGFLMDEPLSNLDAKLRVTMRGEITRLQRMSGTTTIYVTHDQVEAMTMGDRVAVLDRGVLQQSGSPSELYHAPVNVFVAGFIGSPAMNLLQARVGEDGRTLRLLDQVVALPDDMRLDQALAPYRGGEVTLGIRPEHLEIATDPGGALTVTLRAGFVEHLGAVSLCHFDLPQTASDPAAIRGEVLAMLGPDIDLRAGERMALRLPPPRLHFFDPVSGRALAQENPRVQPATK